jgi:hypothetical protein
MREYCVSSAAVSSISSIAFGAELTDAARRCCRNAYRMDAIEINLS